MFYALFDRFEICMSMADAQGAAHPGPCDEDVAALAQRPDIAAQLDAIGAERIRAELKSYGAWDAEQLADDDENRRRIVWCAAGNILDNPR